MNVDDQQTIPESDVDETIATPLVKLGKYSLSSPLGRGSMGEVSLGRNPDLDIPVAVKTLTPHLARENPQYIERFIKEARIAARINHPNIVSTVDAGSDDGIHYIVMEYVDGGTVRQLLENEGRIQVTRAIDIVRSIAAALAAAARYNIIHRDIKPDNIMLTADGTAKLADLGFAKCTDGHDYMNATGTGVSIGTPGYIAPEQAKDAKRVDARSDIYSLGATFYHLCTGEAPFSGCSAFEVMNKHVREPLPHPSIKNPDLPPAVCDIICKMMEKKPRHRYQTAEELLRELDRIAAELSRQASIEVVGRSQRVGAFLIDALLVLIVVYQYPQAWPLVLTLYAWIAVAWRGRTIGKWIYGLRVVDRDGKRLTAGSALFRAACYWLSMAPFGLGFFWALWDRDGEAFHDKIVGTHVVPAPNDSQDA